MCTTAIYRTEMKSYTCDITSNLHISGVPFLKGTF